jgi:hypothetical protein
MPARTQQNVATFCLSRKERRLKKRSGRRRRRMKEANKRKEKKLSG